MERHVSLHAADNLLPRWMHLPAGPRLLEPEQRDEPAFVEIVRVALSIFLVPFEAGESRLSNSASATPEVDRVIEE
jgi:hypothetical protein